MDLAIEAPIPALSALKLEHNMVDAHLGEHPLDPFSCAVQLAQFLIMNPYMRRKGDVVMRH